MKPNKLFTAIGLLVFLLLCFVPSGQAQSCTPFAQAPQTNVALKCIFNSGSAPFSFTAGGSVYWVFQFQPSGTVSAATLSLDSSATGLSGSWSTGGIIPAATIGSLASAGSYSNSSATTPSTYGQLTPTITGTGAVTVFVFGYTNSPAGGGSSGGTVSVSNFPNPQTVNGTVNTQPSGFSSVVSFQQSVTASAVALASNAVHGVCVKALATNTITVYVGPSGVTTSTGYPLNAGDWICYQLTNSNLIDVVASTTGASVAVSGS